jgi:hypothetical protein
MTSYIQNTEIHQWIRQLIPAQREEGKVLLVLKCFSQKVERKKIVKYLLENSHRKSWEANLGTIVCKNRMS